MHQRENFKLCVELASWDALRGEVFFVAVHRLAELLVAQLLDFDSIRVHSQLGLVEGRHVEKLSVGNAMSHPLLLFVHPF